MYTAVLVRGERGLGRPIRGMKGSGSVVWW